MKDIDLKSDNDLLTWLGLNSFPDFTKSRPLGALLSCLAILVICAIGLGVLASLVEFLTAALHLGHYTNGNDSHEAIRNIGLVLAASFGAPFIAWRSYVAHKQTAISEQSHITDQINKAVAGLGAEKNVKSADGSEATHPNIEVRVGAIYALERIAQDSVRDYFTIIELICTYIRENAPLRDYPLRDAPFERPRPRTDIQSAITVLARRSADAIAREHAKKIRLDLSNSDLSGIDFYEGNFSAAIFTGSRIEAASFRKCKLHGSRFFRATLNYSDFFNADLLGTRFDHATFNRPRAVLGGMNDTIIHAKIHGISVAGADFSSADYLGESADQAKIFGSKDTQLADDIQPNLSTLRQLNLQLNRAQREDDEKTMTKTEEALAAFGFRYWFEHPTSDGAFHWSYDNFLMKMGLNGWPYR